MNMISLLLLSELLLYGKCGKGEGEEGREAPSISANPMWAQFIGEVNFMDT